MKRIIFMLVIFMIGITAVSAFEFEVGDNFLINAQIENATVISEESVPDANFTTALNYTFTYHNAKKITYLDNESRQDYLIVWQCDDDEYYETLDSIRSLDQYYSDYTDNGVVFLEITNNQLYGVLLDCENITYSEKELVYDVLGLSSGYMLTNPDYPHVEPQNYYYMDHVPYNGPVITKGDLLRNDPYSYYDYFDYEDDMAADDYLYDNGYDE